MFDSAEHARVELPPAFLKEAFVGHILDQGMLEDVDGAVQPDAVVQELAPPQLVEVGGRIPVLPDGVQHAGREVAPKDGSHLEESLALGR